MNDPNGTPPGRRAGVSGEVSSTLVPGTTLADGRYRVIRVIASGGMGDVYEVEDRELGSRVALKTVRPELAVSARTVQRFRREIQLARQVTHPNVCRIYELGRHSEEDRDLIFLTMQLLRGENLKQRLERDGRLAPEEALPLVRDMAAALDAAHEAGVVHRDFKSANVQLEPDPRMPGEMRAVVTDFGLARDAEQDGDSGSSLTEFGALVGTPGYMAPEQVQGKAATPRSDIYGFGIVLYEMVTGEMPFVGHNALQTAIRRIEQDPPSPADHVPGLDPRWEDAILQCLERDPDDRPLTAAEVVRRIESDPRPAPAGERVRRGWKSALAVLVVVLAIVAALFLVGPGEEGSGEQTPPPETAEADIRLRPAMAVIGFKNLTGDPESDWISTALREMIATEIADEDEIRLLAGEEIEQMKLELGVTAEQTYGLATLEEIRRRLGSDLLVVGSYLRHGEQIRLDLAVQDAHDAEVLHRVSGRSEEDDLIGLVETAGRRLRQEMGLDSARGGELAEAFPVTAEGSRLYSLGLERLRGFEPLEARVLLEAAVEEAPDSPLAHAALAQAWSDLGNQQRALEAARRAHELAEVLGRRERLWIEGLYLELSGQLDAAAKLYAELREENPDDLEAAVRLLRVQAIRGAFAEGLELARELRQLPPPLSTDPRVLLHSANLLVFESSEACIAAAERAIREAEDRRAISLAGRCYERKAWCLFNEARFHDAIGAFNEAVRRYRSTGYRRGLAGALAARAVAVTRIGDYERALEDFPPAIEEARALGDPSLTAQLVGNMGHLLTELGRLEEAAEVWEPLGDPDPTTRFGIIFNTQRALRALAGGDLAQAEEYLQGLERAPEDTASALLQAWADYARGLLARLGGDRSRARTLLERARDASRDAGSATPQGEVLVELGLLAVDEGNPDRARERLVEAAEVFRDAGHPLVQGRIHLTLAEADLAESRLDDALERSGSAQRQFSSLGAHHLEALAHALEADAAAAAGDAERARRALARARELLPRVEHVPNRLRAGFHCDRARIRLGEEPPESLRADVEERLDRAEELGLAPLVAVGHATLALLGPGSG